MSPCWRAPVNKYPFWKSFLVKRVERWSLKSGFFVRLKRPDIVRVPSPFCVIFPTAERVRDPPRLLSVTVQYFFHHLSKNIFGKGGFTKNLKISLYCEQYRYGIPKIERPHFVGTVIDMARHNSEPNSDKSQNTFYKPTPTVSKGSHIILISIFIFK